MKPYRIVTGGLAALAVLLGCETASRRPENNYIPSIASVAYADEPQAKPAEEPKKEELTESEIEKIVKNAKSVEEILAPEIVRLVADYETKKSNLQGILSTTDKKEAALFIYHSAANLSKFNEEKQSYCIRSGLSANYAATHRTGLLVAAMSFEDFVRCEDLWGANSLFGRNTVTVPSFILLTAYDPLGSGTSWGKRDYQTGGPTKDKTVPLLGQNIVEWFDWNFLDNAKMAKDAGYTWRFDESFDPHEVPLKVSEGDKQALNR